MRHREIRSKENQVQWNFSFRNKEKFKKKKKKKKSIIRKWDIHLSARRENERREKCLFSFLKKTRKVCFLSIRFVFFSIERIFFLFCSKPNCTLLNLIEELCLLQQQIQIEYSQYLKQINMKIFSYSIFLVEQTSCTGKMWIDNLITIWIEIDVHF